MNIVFRLVSIALVLIAFNGKICGQGWLREWNLYSFDEAYDVEEATNGDFIVVGSGMYSFIRLTPNGDTVWTQSVSDFFVDEIELIANDTIVAVGSYLSEPAFVKLDPAGNLISIKTYNNLYENLKWIKKTSNGEFIAIKYLGQDRIYFNSPFTPSVDIDTVSFVKLDAEGNVLWTQTPADSFISYWYSEWGKMEINPTSDGGFIVAGSKFSVINSVGYTNAYLIKMNAAGGIVWEKKLNLSTSDSYAYSVKETFDGGYIVSCRDGINSVLVKTNSTGIVQWTTPLFTPQVSTSYQELWEPRDVIEDSDGNYLVTGGFRGGAASEYGLWLYKVNPQGTLLWSKEVILVNYLGYKGNKIKETSDGGYIIAGEGTEFIAANWTFACKVDSAGRITTTFIEGNVYADMNDDCDWNMLDYPLTNWVVTAIGDNGQTYYANTDTSGYYSIEAEMGAYDVTLNIPYPYWDTTCIGLGAAVLDTVFEVDTVDFPVQSLMPCPLLEVDISANFLRLCFTSSYAVQYCNWGSVAAQNAYIEVELDTFLGYDTSSVASTHLGGNLYRFDLGTVPPGYCGTFNIDVDVLCNLSLAGITHCSEARIYPNTSCQTPWTGPNIGLDGSCLGDTVVFQVANTGGNMLASLNYDIFEDNVMMRTGGYQLGTGQIETIYVPAQNGSTYRIEARQVPNFPPLLGDTIVSLAIEGCGVDSLGNIVTGFVTQFSNYDNSPFVDIDCQPNVSSYDPNDKLAYPVGYGVEHYIYDHTDLEYYIRFQNTGTDTAFKVVIIDTISSHLDIASLRVGASSHAYTYEIYGNGIVKFTFDNILLPDSTTNNSASQGFVKYRIEQRSNNPIGTIINNHADIYFDYNPPVRTNTTFHEIGADFVTIQLVGIENVMHENVLVNVYPNPFHEVARVEIEGEEFSKVEFELYDLTGRMVYQKTSSENSFNINKSDLVQGVYVYRIVADGKLLNTGKLIAR